MELMERAGKLFNVDNFLQPVEDSIIKQAIEMTMAPVGTFINGSGSSGTMRRNKVRGLPGSKSSDLSLPESKSSDLDIAALQGPETSDIPGSGWSNVDDKKGGYCC